MNVVYVVGITIITIIVIVSLYFGFRLSKIHFQNKADKEILKNVLKYAIGICIMCILEYILNYLCKGIKPKSLFIGTVVVIYGASSAGALLGILVRVVYELIRNDRSAKKLKTENI